MRSGKDALERRNEILDVAENLFVTNGYDNTSTNDIIKVVGIARGTLYYHFKSKEDILDAMIERIEEGLLKRASVIASDKNIPVLEKIPLTVKALNVDSAIGKEVLEQVHKPQNALLHQKMQKRIMEKIFPLLANIVREGMEEGLFSTKYPLEAVEMITTYSNIAFDELSELDPEVVQTKILAFIENTERVLGAKPGSMMDSMMKIFVD